MFSATFDTAGLAVTALPYPIAYIYTTDGVYGSASASGALTVTPANPTVNVTASSGTYNNTAFPATATVTGIDGTPRTSLEGISLSLVYFGGIYTSTAQLAGVDPLADAPTGAGSYTVLASFPGSTDYSSATDLANFSIAQAAPTVKVTDADGTYDNTAFTATATVTGIDGTPGTSLEQISPILTYYSGTYTSPAELTGLATLPGAPTQAGSYTALASFPGSTDYSSATDLANFSIAQAGSSVNVADSSGTYSNTAFTATATVTGIDGIPGSSLDGVAPLFTYYSGTYSDPPQLTGLTARIRRADRGRLVHGPRHLPRQHQLHRRHGPGQLLHRPGRVVGER